MAKYNHNKQPKDFEARAKRAVHWALRIRKLRIKNVKPAVLKKAYKTVSLNLWADYHGNNS